MMSTTTWAACLVAALVAILTAPDARGTQSARGVQRQAARSQISEQFSIHEFVDDAEPARGELFDQPTDGARRRGRSPRRFDCVRRLLRACDGSRFGSRFGVRRFTAGFFAGHNMVPRHFGEPQRQA